jgi:PIN domain nuclease of toxin-antitoxin system
VATLMGCEAHTQKPISFFEIGQKMRTGRWPGFEGLVSDPPALLEAQSGLIAPFTAAICLSASTMDWVHRDPFDRPILATAVAMGIPLITKDAGLCLVPRHEGRMLACARAAA